MRYPWPGNVRELENLIEMLVVLKEDSEIMISDLPDKILAAGEPKEDCVTIELPDDGLDFNSMIDQFERDLLSKALVKSGGAKKKAADLLHLNRTTFVEKLKRFKIN
jgi:DNA-binding NtrC family response regulator